MVGAEHFEEEKAVGGEEENKVILFAHHRIGERCVRDLSSKPLTLKTSANLG